MGRFSLGAVLVSSLGSTERLRPWVSELVSTLPAFANVLEKRSAEAPSFNDRGLFCRQCLLFQLFCTAAHLSAVSFHCVFQSIYVVLKQAIMSLGDYHDCGQTPFLQRWLRALLPRRNHCQYFSFAHRQPLTSLLATNYAKWSCFSFTSFLNPSFPLLGVVWNNLHADGRSGERLPLINKHRITAWRLFACSVFPKLLCIISYRADVINFGFRSRRSRSYLHQCKTDP